MFTWQNRVAQAGASFFFPIFNYGRLVNQVRVQDAVFEQAVLNYQNTVLTAQQEVEDGLSAFATSGAALTSSRRRPRRPPMPRSCRILQYKAGEAGYTTVVTSEQSLLSIEDSVASTKGNVALALIAIYRALGGGWEIREGGDVISDEVKAEMARRTNWGRLLETAQPHAEGVAGGGTVNGKSCHARVARRWSRSRPSRRSRSDAASKLRRRAPSCRR